MKICKINYKFSFCFQKQTRIVKNKFITSKLFIRSFSSVHVDKSDEDFFKNLKDWWDPEGSLSTLHSYNDLRVKYILKHSTNKPFREFPLMNQSFLDIGCGGGLLCESLARLGSEVIGVDSSENSFEIASNHLNNYQGKELEYMKGKVKYYHGSVDTFPKPEKRFDSITAMEVIEHVNSPKIFIEDIKILLKQEGCFIYQRSIEISYLIWS